VQAQDDTTEPQDGAVAEQSHEGGSAGSEGSLPNPSFDAEQGTSGIQQGQSAQRGVSPRQGAVVPYALGPIGRGAGPGASFGAGLGGAPGAAMRSYVLEPLQAGPRGGFGAGVGPIQGPGGVPGAGGRPYCLQPLRGSPGAGSGAAHTGGAGS
jgi:hypothetical protein